MSDSDSWEDDDNMSQAEIENGHLTSDSEDYEETDSSDEDHPPSCSFDTDLPTVHEYLGKLRHVSGYTLYDDGEIMENLAIYTTTMVFPGFILPLVMTSHDEISIMQKFLNKNKVFILLCANSNFNGIFDYGVTMEVYEAQMQNRILNIKARGRQRCKLVDGSAIKNFSGRMKQVKVKIIAEPDIISPLSDTQFLTLKHRIRCNTNKFSDVFKYKRFHYTQYTLPFWVYEQYEVNYYVRLIRAVLASYFGEYLPEDPLQLSYWIVQNYQLSHEERLHILRLNTTFERLRLEYKLLKLERSMNCSKCDTHLSDTSKVFAMSKEGIQSNYVNPGGHVYETVTVVRAQNFILRGSPSDEFSWFPGYSWTIMHCEICHNHLGWKFTSEELRPKYFYGLAKNSFKIAIDKKSYADYDHALRPCGKSTFASDYVYV